MSSGQDRPIYSNKEAEKLIKEMKERGFLEEKFGKSWQSALWRRGVKDAYNSMKTPEQELEEVQEEIEELEERKQRLQKQVQQGNALEDYKEKKQELQRMEDKLAEIEDSDTSEEEKRRQIRQEVVRKKKEDLKTSPTDKTIEDEAIQGRIDRKVKARLKRWKINQKEQQEIEERVKELRKEVQKYEEEYGF